jgi:hypothetical protein
LKIYSESNQSNFCQVFAELSSMQTLAIYARMLIKGLIARSIATQSKVSSGSRDVFSASHGVLARAGARAVAQGEDA